ncbi:MAG: hypothetical protein KDB21_11155 [Acidimicrobiales bacterium]|nr:hypothetical protein [Acidimicrobiales bacterium]
MTAPPGEPVVSADPDRLRDFTAATVAALRRARSSLDTYRVRVVRHRYEPNDLGARVSDLTPEIEAVLDDLDRADRLAEALAFAMEQLDAGPLFGAPSGWVLRRWPHAVADGPLLRALMTARLDLDMASDGAALDAALGSLGASPAGVAKSLARLLGETEGIDPDAFDRFDFDVAGDAGAIRADGVVWDLLADWLAGPELDSLHAVGRLGPELAELVAIVGLHQDDPAWSAAFFDQLGPAATLQTAELLAALGWADALDGRLSPFGAGVHRSRVEAWSDSLAVASNAVAPGGGHLLGDEWFDELVGPAAVLDDGELRDGVALVFATGVFRRDVAVRAGALGVALLDGTAHVRRAWGQAVLPGFADLVIDRDAEAGMLLGALARTPRAAADVLVAGAEPGGAAWVLTDPSLGGTSAVAAAAVIRAASIELVDSATASTLAGGGTDDLAASYGATAAVLTAVSGRVGRAVTYDPALNAALTDVALSVQHHAYAHSSSGHGPFRVVRPPAATGVDLVVEQPAQRLADLYGVLARVDADRTRLLVATDLAMRRAYLETSAGAVDGEVHRLVSRMATVRGAIVRGQMLATNATVAQVVAERRAANRSVEQAWRVLSSSIGFTPAGGPNEVMRFGLWVIGVGGLDDAVIGQFDRDVDAALDAGYQANRSVLFESAVDSQVFVVGMVYADLHRRLGASPPIELDAPTAALRDELARIAPELDPATTPIDLLDAERLVEIAEEVTRSDNAVGQLWAEADRRIDELHPEVDVEPGASIGGS